MLLYDSLHIVLEIFSFIISLPPIDRCRVWLLVRNLLWWNILALYWSIWRLISTINIDLVWYINSTQIKIVLVKLIRILNSSLFFINKFKKEGKKLQWLLLILVIRSLIIRNLIIDWLRLLNWLTNWDSLVYILLMNRLNLLSWLHLRLNWNYILRRWIIIYQNNST